MPRAIDHLVLAAHNLTAQAEIYRRMGFTVGSRNRHPWGTENHIIQFAESFLELIALGEGFPGHENDNFFAQFLGAHLQQREGLAMTCLRTADASADAETFAKQRIGDGVPYHFGRKAKRADGSEAEVAFTLAFAQDRAMPEAGFFTCQQHFPQNFWNKAFQTHANGARAVTAVMMQADEPAATLAFFTIFTEATEIFEESDRVGFVLADRRRIEVLWTHAAEQRYAGNLPALLPRSPSFLGCRISVADLGQLQAVLDAGKIPYQKRDEGIIVPAHALCGAMIIFEATKDAEA